MPDSPNKLSQFWQELKRRKVVRVITVYAAASFVILELLSIIIDPLKLPEWTLPLVIVLLCIGFIIAVIVSWIYDIHPEEGVVKTKPAHKVKEGDTWDSSKSWRIASYVSFGVIIVLIIFNIIPRSSMFNDRGSPDRSIAVIPFRNDSPEEEKMYFINGTMEQILDNLGKIDYLRVVSRTSVEQYRDNTKTLSVIADEMDVGYVLEGSGQRDGNRVRITVQLLDATKDMHIWSQTYHREIVDVFDMQSEVARLVAKDLEAVISPESDLNSDELTAERKEALVFYRRGLREMNGYWENYHRREFLEKAEDLFRYSLDYDSTFIEPYQHLTEVYWEKYWKRYGEREVMLDSALVMADKALQMGSQDSETLYVKGRIYLIRGQVERAREVIENAILYDPGNSRAYMGLADTYMDTDVIKSLEIWKKALECGSQSTNLYKKLHNRFKSLGFKELSRHYLDKAFKLDSDSLDYYRYYTWFELLRGDYKATREFILKTLAMDSLNSLQLELMGIAYMGEGMYDSSLVYYRKAASVGRGVAYQRLMGYVLVQNGEVAEGERYINESFVSYQERLNREQVSSGDYLTLGELYAYRGEKEKALEHLRTFTKQDGIDLDDLQFLRSPLLDNIRDEPEFQEIVQELESIVQAKHERVRQWLEENDML